MKKIFLFSLIALTSLSLIVPLNGAKITLDEKSDITKLSQETEKKLSDSKKTLITWAKSVDAMLEFSKDLKGDTDLETLLMKACFAATPQAYISNNTDYINRNETKTFTNSIVTAIETAGFSYEKEKATTIAKKLAAKLKTAKAAAEAKAAIITKALEENKLFAGNFKDADEATKKIAELKDKGIESISITVITK